MKVSILPWLDIANYGSILQIFAVYKVLEKYCDEVQVISYMQNSKFRNVVCRNPVKIINNVLSYLFLKNNFRKISPLLNLTREHYSTEEDFENYIADADIYCTSSDQIWNTNYGHSVIGPRFLNFLPEDKRRFAFSSSFGDRISDEIVEKSRSWINRFESISVREDVGLRIINEKYNYKKAVQLIDPTLMLNRDFWLSYTTTPKIQGDYIFVYDLMNNKQFFEYAKELSKKTGLPIIHLCHRIAQVNSCKKSILFPPVFDFIALINNAKYVLTGSFHATAFAINLNKEPICVYHSRNPSRLTSFLRLIDAENLAIKDFNDFNVVNRAVDFVNINSILSHERKRAEQFFEEIFLKEG